MTELNTMPQNATVSTAQRGKKRGPGRPPGRTTTKKPPETEPLSKRTSKLDTKPEKAKPDPKGRETVVTEQGHVIHPNGSSHLNTHSLRSHLLNLRTSWRTVLYRSSDGIYLPGF
jgi:hypothetical protein